MIPERSGLIVWINDIKSSRVLERYGTVHYVSKKMHYVLLYVDAVKEKKVVQDIQKLPFVKKIEKSLRNEIKTEYNSNIPDKTRFYTI
ncbi:YlbG family protein [Ferviditalea candida]|uniref:YlbG family protein n=1 Tax=Ferviditalea candida TaxID=3108399 RepID=A0ABU5ZIV3_9BACL|nr:YlbG family protein [Paenibacillaceae bacterium T2]